MAIKKQLVADSGILSQGAAQFNSTVNISGATTANGVSANSVAVTNGVTANTLSSNSVATVTTTSNTVTANVVTVGSTTANTTVVNSPTVNAASVIATTANVGTLNSTGLANVASANVVGSLNVGGNVAVGGNMTVTGTVTIQGGTTTINSAQLSVADNIITLNSDVVGAPTENAGIEVNRGTSANTGVRWNETTKVWETADGSGVYAAVRRVGTDIALGSETSGNYVATATGSGNGLTVSGGAGSEGATVTISMAAANTTTVGAVQLIDSVASANITTAATPNSVQVAYNAAISANTLAAGKVASVSGTTGRISSSGGTAPALDLVTTGITPGTWIKATYDAYGRATANGTVSTDDIPEGTAQYFTTARARSSLVQGTGISYDSPSGTITNSDPGSAQLFFKSIADSVGTVQFAATTNQDTIRFGGGVGITATLNATSKMVSFDSTGVTSFNSRTGAVTLTSSDISAVRGTIVNSFNSRVGNVSLTASDVNGALGYTAANAATAGGTNASALSTGTVPTGRISGAYNGITSVGTLGSLNVSSNIDTNTITNGDGSAAAPSFTFSADSDTGMYRVTTNQLGWSTAGAVRLTLSTSTLAMTGSITASGTITASSDERLKENIQDISPGEGMNAVMAFAPVKFTRIADGSRSSGYIAQEFREVAPEQVIEDENGMLSIDLVGASPYHTAAIQFLYNRVQTLTEKVARLEGRH